MLLCYGVLYLFRRSVAVTDSSKSVLQTNVEDLSGNVSTATTEDSAADSATTPEAHAGADVRNSSNNSSQANSSSSQETVFEWRRQDEVDHW